MQQDTRQPVAPNDVVGLLQQLNAHTMLLRLLTSLAEVGLADRLASGPATPAALAAALDLDAGRLHRVLRFVASYGFFREDEAGRYHLSPRAEALRADVPGSVRERLRQPWHD
jgi:DNA-binding IclR family transcriptional regulator